MKTILVALRFLFRFKAYSGINILGLGLSLACVIIISRYLHGELTVNSHTANMERVFVSTMEMENRGMKMVLAIGTTPPERAAGFKDLRNDPAVESNARFMISEQEQFIVNGYHYSIPTVATEEAFLTILDYPVIRGQKTLERKEDVFITEQFAQKLFGNADPIGQTLTHSATEKTLNVVGILGNVDFKRSIPFDLVINRKISESWAIVPHTLLRLYPGTDYMTLNSNYSAFDGVDGSRRRFQLMPLKEAYWTDLPAFGFIKGNKLSIIVLAAVGIMALLAGLINFINIYSIILLRRNRELGMRKVFGTSGRQIFLQIFTENASMVLLALLLAFILAELFKPALENWMEVKQSRFLAFDIYMLIGMLIVIPVLATVFPYVHYRRASPIELLYNNTKGKHNVFSRKIYLTVQYVVTLIMVVTSLFFVRQYRVYSKANPGFKTENIVQATFFPRVTNTEVYKDEERRMAEQTKMKGYFDKIRQAMNETPLFSFWTFAQDPIRMADNKVQFKTPDGEKKEVTLFRANPEWMELFDIPLIDGKVWDETFVEFLENDVYTMMDRDIVLTESALKLFEISDFTQTDLESEDIPTQYLIRDGKPTPRFESFNIIGVTKDVRGDHASKQSPPVIFINTRNAENYPIMAEVVPGQKTEAVAFLKKLHDETFGGDFSYSFIENDVADIYKEDRKIATLYSIFTCVAIIISAIGLFSISLYDIQQRRKEIAIRKVNGAGIFDILKVLFKDYLTLLVLSFIIAVPISCFVIFYYLSFFSYRISIPAWIFPAAFVFTACVSLLTLIWNAMKAAKAAPAVAIRN